MTEKPAPLSDDDEFSELTSDESGFAADAHDALVAIDEDVIPEPRTQFVDEVRRRPLNPREWDRRVIALVALFVYAVVILGVLAKLLIFGPVEGVSAAMVISTAAGSFSMIVGFYFGSTSK